uniref:60S ribosomal protein L31-like n=1 Tax=Halichoerus grypus TaxID=9711 RepID=UPI00165965DC|nr:60S ribosomal protein L31-like [Halichoerus grypus]
MKSHSATNKVTGEYTITVHKCIHAVSVKRCAPWVFKETQKFAMREMGTSDVCIDTRCNKALRAKRIRDVSSHIGMRLSRKCNDSEDSPDKLRLPVYLSPLSKI